MQDLSLMTWKEVAEIDKNKSILFVTVAPIEEHGIHLPLATDVIEGENWSGGAMEILEQATEYRCYFLPAFPIAAASVNSFYGCIHFPMRTVCKVVRELLESLACMGFWNVVVVASHADPEHQIAVEKAVRSINRRYGEIAIAPMGAFFDSGKNVVQKQPAELQKYEESHPDDFHAGWVETSCMQAFDKDYVRDGIEHLPKTQISVRDMISKKRQRLAMGEYGHMGNPAAADYHIGKLLNNDCAEYLARAAQHFAKRDGYQAFTHYALYDIVFMHIGFWPMLGRVKRKKVSK